MSARPQSEVEQAIIDRMLRRVREKAARGRPLLPDPSSFDHWKKVDHFKHVTCGSTLGFTKTFWPVIEPDRPFVPGWHLNCVGEHLDEVSNPGGCLKNLIINVPPRTSKSLMTCVFWFCKTWAQRPHTRWMFASFGGDLVQRDSQRCREIIATPLYQRMWDVRVKRQQDTQLRYTNLQQGFRYAVTVGGQGMGEGADFLVIDDPQNPRRAASAVERENTIRWYRATFSRRVNDEVTGRRVIIMQRLNERDLTGFLVAEQLGWEHLVLPMRYEPRRYWFGGGEVPEGMRLEGDDANFVAAAAGVPHLRIHRPETDHPVAAPDAFSLPNASRPAPQPGTPPRQDYVQQFLDLVREREAEEQAAAPPQPPAQETPHEARRDAPAADQAPDAPEAGSAAVGDVAGQDATKPPRDCIRLTALQLKNPLLMDGPAGSGRRAEGDLLWPERFPESAVAKAEDELGPDAPGQYAQRPTGESGDIFRAEMFRKYEPIWDLAEDERTGLPVSVFGRVRLYGPNEGQVREFAASHLTWFQTIDTALTEGRRSAYTAVLTFGVTPEYDVIVWNAFRGKLNVQYQYPLIKLLRHGPVRWVQRAHTMTPTGAWPFRVAVQAVENKASGAGIIAEAATDGNPLHPLAAEKDKVTRAVCAVNLYAAGKVYHPMTAGRWLADMEDELLQFPHGAYKDVADCVAHAGNMVVRDKLIRGLCSRVVLSDAEDTGGRDDVTRINLGGAEHKVEWPDEGPHAVPRQFGQYRDLLEGIMGGGDDD